MGAKCLSGYPYWEYKCEIFIYISVIYCSIVPMFRQPSSKSTSPLEQPGKLVKIFLLNYNLKKKIFFFSFTSFSLKTPSTCFFATYTDLLAFTENRNNVFLSCFSSIFRVFSCYHFDCSLKAWSVRPWETKFYSDLQGSCLRVPGRN